MLLRDRATTPNHERAARAGSMPPRAVMALLSTVGALWAAGANGAWESVPEVLLAAESNDNPRLRAEEPGLEETFDDPATRLLADIRVEFANFTPRGVLTFEPAVRSDVYADADHDDLQSTDVFVLSSGRYDWERASLGFGLDLSRQRILGAEFLDAGGGDLDADDPELVDTALVGLNERRSRYVLSPYTEFEAGERSSVRLDGRFMDVSYDDDLFSVRSDFTDLLVGAEYIRRPSTRGTISGRLFASRFEADANANESDTVGAEMRFARSLSDIWSVNFAWGVERSDFMYLDATTGASVTGTDDNFSLGLGLRKRTEISSINVDLTRRVSPDSFGFLVVRNQLRLAVLKQMSPTVRGTVGVRAIRTDGIEGSVVQGDRSYGRIDFGIDWAVSELWSVVVGYEYSSRDAAAGVPDASSNTFSVGLNYRGRSQRQL